MSKPKSEEATLFVLGYNPDHPVQKFLRTTQTNLFLRLLQKLLAPLKGEP